MLFSSSIWVKLKLGLYLVSGCQWLVSGYALYYFPLLLSLSRPRLLFSLALATTTAYYCRS